MYSSTANGRERKASISDRSGRNLKGLATYALRPVSPWWVTRPAGRVHSSTPGDALFPEQAADTLPGSHVPHGFSLRKEEENSLVAVFLGAGQSRTHLRTPTA